MPHAGRTAGRVAPAIAILAALLIAAATAGAAPYVYVADLGSGDVAIVDTTTRNVVGTLAAGENPNGVAVSPDGTRAYVTDFVSGVLTIIDTSDNTVVNTVQTGSGPVGVAVATNGATAYVTNRGDDTVAVVDTASGRVRALVPVGDGPDAVAVTPDGRSAYVTNSFTGMPGEVSVLNLADNTVRGTVLVHRGPNRVAISPDGARAYVTNFRAWNLSVIDTAANAVVDTLRVGRKPTSVAVNPNGAYAYVTTQDQPDNIAIVETATDRITGFMQADVDPRALAVDHRGGLGYAANFGSDTVTVLDLGEQTAVDEIAVGNRPFALAVNCVGSACRARPFTPKPTATPTRTATAAPPTATPTATMTAGATSTQGPPTTTPVPVVFLQVGSASGHPGDRVAITVRLDARGYAVAGAQNDILFGPAAPIAPRADGRPDCAVNPAIDKRSTVFAFLPADCAPGSCDAVRALVLSFENNDPIADGSVLYTCQVAIASNAVPGTYAFASDNEEASTPDGQAIPAAAVGGSVTVLGAAVRAEVAAPATGARLCSAGTRDGSPCSTNADCPGGACAAVQGVCDGGADDGLLCDCPGATCAGQPVCGDDPQLGTCSGGALDGACCDRTFNCGGGAACTATYRLCASGPSKGMPCLADHHCVGAACVAVARVCAGGEFASSSCIDDGGCPRGTCVDAGGVTPSPTSALPTATPSDPGSSSSGCAVDQRPADGAAWWLLTPLPIWIWWRPGRCRAVRRRARH